MRKPEKTPTLLDQFEGDSGNHALYAALQTPSLRAEALLTQGLIAIQNQTPHLALLPIAQVANLLPSQEQIWLLLGHVFELLNQPQYAQVVYENALYSSPNNPDLIKRCASIYQKIYSGSILSEKLAALQLLEDSASLVNPKWGYESSNYSPPLKSTENDTAVDVLVPVYKGYQQTLECIQSLLAYQGANQTIHHIVVLDDAGPEPKLAQALTELAQTGAISYIRRPTNLGFIRNMNLGMAIHPGRDVVWLNSDTRVHGNWLDRLRSNAYSAQDIASATPLSNNGELMSFPDIQQKSAMPTPEEQSNVDLIASLLNPAPVDIPLGCGFCLYIKRQALDEVGYLDELTLQRGYGEETDWCLRASEHGWRHVGASNLFVAHQGGVSFGLEKALRAKQNNALLNKRYPKAEGLCARFVRADPLRQIRKTLFDQLSQNKHSLKQTAAPFSLEKLLSARDAYWVIADPLDTAEEGNRWLNFARYLRRQGFTGRLILMHDTPWELALARTGTVLHLPTIVGIEPATLLTLCQAKQALTLSEKSCNPPLAVSKLQLSMHYLSDLPNTLIH